MIVGIDATSLSSAGGRRVGSGVVSALPSVASSSDQFVVLAPRNAGYASLGSERVDIRFLPQGLQAGWRRLQKERWMKGQLEDVGVDVVFSMGNIPLPTSIPQLLLIHWSYLVYPDSEVWKRMTWAGWIRRAVRFLLIRHRLPHATKITVQTDNMSSRLYNQLIEDIPIEVVPSAVNMGVMVSNYDGKSSEKSGYLDHLPWHMSRGAINILCLSRHYAHKNIEVLPRVAEVIRENRLPIRIVTTIDPDERGEAGSIVKYARERGLKYHFVNLGPIPPDEVSCLLGSVDGMVLPTLMESFGLPYVEAMSAGVPVFTSNRSFAKSVCGEAAFYFNPHEPADIAHTIEKGLSSSRKIEEHVRRGREIVRNLPDWEEVTSKYLRLLRELKT